MAPAEKEKPTQEKSFSKLMKNHLERSSAPGLPNINRSESLLGKAFWGILVICGVCIVCWQINRLYNEYKSYPIRVTMTYEYSRSLHFPAVTICNLNALRSSMLDHVTPVKPPPPPDDTARQMPSSAAASATVTDRSAPGGSSVYETATPTLTVNGQKHPPPPPEPCPGIGEPRKGKCNNTDLVCQLFNTTDEERRAMGHQLSDMLLGCSWNSESCYYTDFAQHFNTMYGNCYTFNSGKNSTQIHSSTMPGETYGLRLELYIEQDEYMVNYTETAGIRVLLHNQLEMPFPEEEGFNIPPGMLTAAGFRQKSTVRLSEPHGKCHMDGKDDDEALNYFKEQYGVNYSIKVCQRSCYQSWVITTCNCADPNYPRQPEVRTCDIIGGLYPGDPDCLQRANELYVDNKLDCGCTQLCREKEFIVAVSSSLWPANKYDQEVIGKIKPPLKGKSKQETHAWLMDNVARLDVYFEHLNYENIQEKPAYTEENLLSDIGGQLGLWIGISLITMFEFFDLFGSVASYIWRTISSYLRQNNKHLLSKVAHFKLLRQSSAGSENKDSPVVGVKITDNRRVHVDNVTKDEQTA